MRITDEAAVSGMPSPFLSAWAALVSLRLNASFVCVSGSRPTAFPHENQRKRWAGTRRGRDSGGCFRAIE